MRHRLAGVGVAALLLAVAAPGQAAAASKKRCFKVSAKGVGHNDNATNSTDVTFSKDRLLKGKATGGFKIVGGAPPVFEITTDLTFKTRYGKLTVDTEGSMDISDGAFESKGPIRSGTKRFKGATGTLKFVGKADIASGDFTDKVTGRVCARKAFALR
jgi:hypothetical protein